MVDVRVSIVYHLLPCYTLNNGDARNTRRLELSRSTSSGKKKRKKRNPQRSKTNNVNQPRNTHLQLQVLGLLVFPRCKFHGLNLEVLHILLKQSGQHSGSASGPSQTHNRQTHGYRSQQITDKQTHPQAIDRCPEDSNESTEGSKEVDLYICPLISGDGATVSRRENRKQWDRVD